ncbi:EAL domain-containing protein [Citrobacter sp. Marseille-Q6884]|uniref:EAL domain-containing protein n=1 Tax=Citrobacter sp. Marseille-Q6884 TaxID=2956786 RepID=UPI0021B1C2A7|nr:EAL domain-containing protein [Citrobacter sp. Marseille-Q6884]
MYIAKKDAVPFKMKTNFLYTSLFFLFFQFIEGNLTTHEHIASTTLRFYDLSLPLISAFLVLYRINALPALSILWIYSLTFNPLPDTIILTSQLLAALMSQILYYRSTGKRGIVSFGRSQFLIWRLGWLICCNSALFIIFNCGLQSWFGTVLSTDIFSQQVLINLQWVMNSCITGIPFCYLLLRICNKPKWGLNYINRMSFLIKTGPRPEYQCIWLLLIIIIMACLISEKNSILLFTDYSSLWLLPIMLWGAINIGHALLAPIWVIILILLGVYVNGYIFQNDTVSFDNYIHSLIISSTILFIYSLSIVTTGILSDRNRRNVRHLTRLYRSEPNTGLPNLHALRMDVMKKQTKVLCQIRFLELNELEQTYGVEFRFGFIKALSSYLTKLLHCHEQIYYTPGQGLILRLNSTPDISFIYNAVNNFRFKWDNFTLGINCGIAYTTDEYLIHEYSETIKKLRNNSHISILQGRPIAISGSSPGENIISTGLIRDVLQKAIDRQSFQLMAQPIMTTMLTVQPIISNCGKTHYHEILTRLKTEDGKLIFPDTFISVARKGGLLPSLDITVIEQTLHFMQSRKNSAPDCFFSINLMPESMIQTNFLANVQTLFKKYKIAPNRIIFEIIESEILDNEHVSNTLNGLRETGSRIAIDDFGTGSSSYERLRSLDADILKIDGSFIKKITSDPFSYCAVKSFCEIAKLKKMVIVAEFVENEEIAKMLIDMGVDWLQGYHIGKPVPIELAQL